MLHIRTIELLEKSRSGHSLMAVIDLVNENNKVNVNSIVAEV